MNKDRIQYSAVHTKYFLNSEIINEHAIGMGDEVFLVGRLIDNSGIQQNTPAARFGCISMMPKEPVWNDFLERKTTAFLCEVKSIGGHSGSPVFVHILPNVIRPVDPDGSVDLGGPYYVWLMGIDWGHTLRRHPVKTEDGKPTNYVVTRNSGISCVAPAWDILTLLNHDQLRASRKRTDAELRRQIACSPSILAASNVNQIAESITDEISEK